MDQGSLATLLTDPLGLIDNGHSREALVRAIGQLVELKQQVLSMTHEHSMSMLEIGAVLGIGESGARRVYAQAIVDLQRLLV